MRALLARPVLLILVLVTIALGVVMGPVLVAKGRILYAVMVEVGALVVCLWARALLYRTKRKEGSSS